MFADLVDSVLKVGGDATAWVRSSRLLELYRRKLESSVSSWRGAREELLSESEMLKRTSEKERRQLNSWGLVRLLPHFEASWRCRERRSALLVEIADKATAAVADRLAETKRRMSSNDATLVLTDGFCNVPAAVVAASSPEVRRLKLELASLEEENRTRAGILRSLRPRLARKKQRGQLLLDEGMVEEVVCDQREREGRLLARWIEQRSASATPVEISAFSNFMAVKVAELLPSLVSEDEEWRVKRSVVDLVLRKVEDGLVPPELEDEIRTRDDAFRVSRQHIQSNKLLNETTLSCDPRLLVVDSTRLESLLASPSRDDEDDEASTRPTVAEPTRLADALLDALHHLHDQAGRALEDAVSADDLLPALVVALVNTQLSAPRPHRALYLIRTYASVDSAAAKKPELEYFLTTFDAALAVVLELGGTSRAQPSPISRGMRRRRGASFDVDNNKFSDDDAMRQLGDWIGKHVAMEETLQLLSEEGWVSSQ